MAEYAGNTAAATTGLAAHVGKHVRLPFSSSTSFNSAAFTLNHCDIWTTPFPSVPFPSVSGFKYYLIIVDDFSHYMSDLHSTLSHFHAFVRTHFRTTIAPSNATMVAHLITTQTATSSLPLALSLFLPLHLCAERQS
jgi:hypothetical protein